MALAATPLPAHHPVALRAGQPTVPRCFGLTSSVPSFRAGSAEAVAVSGPDVMESPRRRSFQSLRLSPTSPSRSNPHLDDAQARASNVSRHATSDLRSDGSSSRSGSVSSSRRKPTALRPTDTTSGWGVITPRKGVAEPNVPTMRHSAQRSYPPNRKRKLSSIDAQKPSLTGAKGLSTTPQSNLAKRQRVDMVELSTPTVRKSTLPDRRHDQSTDNSQGINISRKVSEIPTIFISAINNNIEPESLKSEDFEKWLEGYNIHGTVAVRKVGVYLNFPDYESASKCFTDLDGSDFYIASTNSYPLGKGKTLKMNMLQRENATPLSRSRDTSIPTQSARVDAQMLSSACEASAENATTKMRTEQPTSVTPSSLEPNLDGSTDRPNLINSSLLSIVNGSAQNERPSATTSTIKSSQAQQSSTAAMEGDYGDWGLPMSPKVLPLKATISPIELQQEVTVHTIHSIPANIAQRTRSPLEDDVSSVLTPSESSSKFSIGRPCHICRQSHTDTRNSLVRCNTCPRKFHNVCQKPPKNEGEIDSDWRCYHCLKRVAVQVKRVQNSEIVSESPRLPQSAPPSSVALIENVPSNGLHATESLEGKPSAEISGHNHKKRTSVRESIPELHLDVESEQYCRKTIPQATRVSSGQAAQSVPVSDVLELEKDDFRLEPNKSNDADGCDSRRDELDFSLRGEASSSDIEVTKPENIGAQVRRLLSAFPSREANVNALKATPARTSAPEVLSQEVVTGTCLASERVPTRGSMAVGPSSTERIGEVDIEISMTGVALSPPTAEEVLQRKSYELTEDQRESGNPERTGAPIMKRAKRSKQEAVRCTKCRKTRGFFGPRGICNSCKIDHERARREKSSQILLQSVERPLQLQNNDTSMPSVQNVPSLKSLVPLQNQIMEKALHMNLPDSDAAIPTQVPAEKVCREETFSRSPSSPLSTVPSDIPSPFEISEVSEISFQESSTPHRHPTRALVLREINALALLALKNGPTVAEMAEWFCTAFPSQPKAKDPDRLGKSLSPVLSQNKDFIGWYDGRINMRYKFIDADTRRRYERELADFLRANRSESSSDAEVSADDSEIQDSHADSDLANELHTNVKPKPALLRSHMKEIGFHWEQVRRGVYKRTRGQTTDGNDKPHSRAQEVSLEGATYSRGGFTEYRRLDDKGREQEACGKIIQIELQDDVRCQFQVSRYVDKSEAESLGCRNLREWPRSIKYIRREPPLKEWICEDKTRVVHGDPSNRVSQILVLSREDEKHKIRVDASMIDQQRMRRGMDWVESSSDIEEPVKSTEPSSQEVTPKKQALHLDQTSELVQKKPYPLKEPLAIPSPSDDLTERDTNSPGVSATQLEQAEGNIRPGQQSLTVSFGKPDEAVETDFNTSHKPKILSPPQAEETTGTALPAATITTETIEQALPSTGVFVPPMNRDPKIMILEKDFNKAFPEYTILTPQEKARKINEISKRPSRKATFGKSLGFARTYRKHVHVEVDPPKRSGPILSSMEFQGEELEEPSTTSLNPTPDSARNLFRLPDHFIPILYEHSKQLAFRLGTPGTSTTRGRNSRAKVYKIGRNVAGRLK